MPSDVYVKANPSGNIHNGCVITQMNTPSGIYHDRAQVEPNIDHVATKLDTRFDDVNYY